MGTSRYGVRTPPDGIAVLVEHIVVACIVLQPVGVRRGDAIHDPALQMFGGRVEVVLVGQVRDVLIVTDGGVRRRHARLDDVRIRRKVLENRDGIVRWPGQFPEPELIAGRVAVSTTVGKAEKITLGAEPDDRDAVRQELAARIRCGQRWGALVNGRRPGGSADEPAVIHPRAVAHQSHRPEGVKVAHGVAAGLRPALTIDRVWRGRRWGSPSS